MENGILKKRNQLTKLKIETFLENQKGEFEMKLTKLKKHNQLTKFIFQSFCTAGEKLVDSHTYRVAVLLMYLLCTVNCSPMRAHERGVYIDPEFAPYVANFEILSIQFARPMLVRNVSAVFVDSLPGNWVGVCRYNATNRIEVLRVWWQFALDSEREVLMLHELGHCVLGRGHTETYTNGQPSSIMYPSVLSGYQYESNREQYLQEYFGHVRLYQ